jgi:hypothetical protein
MIRIGLKTKQISAKIIEFEYLEVKREALIIMPYGVMANAPIDSMIVSYCQDGHADSRLAYPSDPENIDELEEYEVSFGIPSKKARVKFDKDDNIIITGADGESEIKLNKDGKLTGKIKDVFELEDGYGSTIKSTTQGRIRVNEVWEILQP